MREHSGAGGITCPVLLSAIYPLDAASSETLASSWLLQAAKIYATGAILACSITQGKVFP
jgi:hypothetical protein